MKSKRKIIACISTSVDGYIARPDGDVEWLNRPGTKGDYGMGEFLGSVDTILWGRKTYEKGIEMGMKEGMKAAGFGPEIQNYVFSRQLPQSPEPGFEFVSEPIKTLVQQLRAQRGKDIWMMGGGGIIASFLDEGEIDEFRISVVPIMIGEGIPLVQPRRRSIPLKLLSSKRFPDGVVRLNYRVG